MSGNHVANLGNLPIEPLVLRLPAAGVLLGGVTRPTVAKLIAEGELEPVWIGGTRMVTRRSCEAYVERQAQKARAAREAAAVPVAA